MSERPRRSRQRARSRTPKYPLIGWIVAVVLGGFVIGASFAFYRRTHEGPAPAVATPSAPPAAATPLATSSAVASASPSPAPAATVSPSPAPSASPSPSPSPSSEAAVATPSAAPSSSPSAVSLSASAAAPASVSAAPAPSDEADTDFSRLAAVVVRQYIAALQRGDDAAAYAAFGAPSGANGISFVEKRYVDQTTRIVRVSSTGTDDAATVDVELRTAGTTYFAQYFLTRSGSGAAVIQRHTISKA